MIGRSFAMVREQQPPSSNNAASRIVQKEGTALRTQMRYDLRVLDLDATAEMLIRVRVLR